MKQKGENIMSKTLRLAGILPNSIVDGPGVRMVVFVQGCEHKCLGCHNPDTHPLDGGYEMSVDALVDMMEENRLIDGVTLSGGEPMLQPAALASFARQARIYGHSVWCYTGFTLESLLEENNSDRMALLSQVDVLVDGRFVLAKKTLSMPFVGSSNQRILDVPASLKQKAPVLWNGE